MKLKTLKDIHMEEYMRLIIKQEAIKWVKDKCPETPTCERCKGAIIMFKHFFNITEKDLK